MIRKTRAIVLRVSPFSETSRVVLWLTPDAGKLAALVKGSQRPRSVFLGQYDLFYTCELLYYSRDRDMLHITRECAPLKSRDRLRTDWKAAACASYLVDLVARVLPSGTPHPELFDLLDRQLDELAANGANEAAQYWFELKLLECLGLSPRFHLCVECGGALRAGARGSHFAYARGGILCSGCAAASRDLPPIAPDVVATLLGWQRAPSGRVARSTRCTARQLEDVAQLLGLFLRYHLDLSLASRKIALDLIRAPRPRAA